MWYVIQTITGEEQETADSIHRVLNGNGYRACFVIWQECVWRLEGKYKVYLKPLFPSYVFVDTDSPEQFYFALKKVPKDARLLGGGGDFCEVREEERKLLCWMMSGTNREEKGEYIVRRSPVRVNEDGEIIWAGGALEANIKHIVKKRLRKRSVVIEVPFLGETRRLQLGIRLEGDEALEYET